MAGGGHYKVSSGGNGGGRGRPYAVILLLAFGAALVGVMVVHKLRERRIFNLLVQEKDRDLLSLQLLFQKEREYNREMKRKAAEMKAKIYSLRTQKMELDRRLLEMQSTIDSLKDEQKMMESALEEKQNEIKMLRVETTDSGHENLRVMTLMESLKQKESEIEDLKHRLELPARVWSVGTDDPSKPLVNLTSTGGLNQKEETRVDTRGGEGNQEHESTSSTDGLNTMKGEDAKESKSADFREEESGERVEEGAEGKIGATAAIEITGRETQKPENLQDSINTRVSGEVNNEASQYTVTSGSQGSEEISSDVSEVIINRGRQEQKTILTREPRKLEDLQGDQNKELQAITEGGTKLEMQNDLRNGAGSRSKGKHGHLSRTKGKRWRILTKNRLLEKNLNSQIDEVARRRRRDRSRSREEEKTSSEGKMEGEEGEKDENTSLGKKEMDTAGDKLLKGVAKEDAVEVKIASNDEMQENNNVADSTTDMEDNKDGYKEEREESEF